MERFKIDHFVKEQDSVPFPHYESLGAQECKDIFDRLSRRLGLSTDNTGLMLVSKLAELQVICSEVSAENEEFSLEKLANSIGIKPQHIVFVNWYRFDQIDRLSFTDLSKFFDDIWYPGSDDIDIFDSSLLWVLSVTHEGCVQYVEFLSEQRGQDS